jgi:signal peptidase I
MVPTVKNTAKTFGVLCLSAGAGLFLYWTMFLLSNFLRVQRFGTEIPNVNFSTGVIGAVCVALLTLGLISLKSKSTSTLVMVRTAQGRVGSIVKADYSAIQLSGNHMKLGVKTVSELPQLKKHRRLKYFVGVAAIAVVVSGYFLTALLMGFTLQGIMFAGSSPLMVVSSQSMKPALNYGDLILMKGERVDDVSVGDIIAFNVPSPYDQVASSPTVHRVVEKLSENGEIYFKTKGDGNANADAWIVPAGNVVGVYTQNKIPYLGSLVIFLKSPPGLSSLILVFALVFFYSYYKKKESHKNAE